jgi:amino acid transporter, AAT family
MAGELRPRWGQPLTGIISSITFFGVALLTWYIFSDPRGPVASFPYPFVLYLAMMILVGLWQHMFLGDWPFQNLSPPVRGVVQTIMNLVIVWFVIHIIFYRVLGVGFNFLSQINLENLAAAGKTILPDACGKTLTYEALINPGARFAERAVVCFVLIGFFSYPFITILFGKWPIRPSNLTQPQAGFAEIGWATMLTLFFYVVLIVPFWGLIWEKMFGSAYGFNTPWWGAIAGTPHVHWVFGWWEWAIIILFMTPNVWRMKPWTLIKLEQPWKGLFSFIFTIMLGYLMAWLCVTFAGTWIDMDDIVKHLPAGDKMNPMRFLWYHAAEIAGFTLIPFLAWHHYFDDACPMADKDSWGGFWYRTVGVLVLMVINYVFFYHLNFGHWGLGNHHMEGGLAERFIHGESLIWNFWWIIPLLWNEWFFHKWPFYVHDEHH